MFPGFLLLSILVKTLIQHMHLPVTPTGDIKLSGAAGMLKDRIRIHSDAYNLEQWFEGKASGGSLWACGSTTFGQKCSCRNRMRIKKTLCSCSLGKDPGIVLNEKLNVNQHYFPL